MMRSNDIGRARSHQDPFEEAWLDTRRLVLFNVYRVGKPYHGASLQDIKPVPYWYIPKGPDAI